MGGGEQGIDGGLSVSSQGPSGISPAPVDFLLKNSISNAHETFKPLLSLQNCSGKCVYSHMNTGCQGVDGGV